MLFLLLITIMSMLVAAIMSAIAWHVGKEEQRRAAARVDALAADIHRDATPDFDLRARDIREDRFDRHVAMSGGDLFAAHDAARSTSSPARLASVIAAVGVVALAAGSVVYFSSGARGSSNAVTAASAAADAPAGDTTPANQQHATDATPAEPRVTANVGPAPLELIALGHVREGDRLIVRGVVRNPSAAEVDRLTAVVFVFNSDGGFLASGRAAVQSSALAPGTESTFAVTVPGATDVARYRVSFRADDRVVPHVDRRELRTPGQGRQEKS